MVRKCNKSWFYEQDMSLGVVDTALLHGILSNHTPVHYGKVVSNLPNTMISHFLSVTGWKSVPACFLFTVSVEGENLADQSDYMHPWDSWQPLE